MNLPENDVTITEYIFCSFFSHLLSASVLHILKHVKGRTCYNKPIKHDILVLTMNFLWSKGKNKLHFSIFWKPVVCTQREQ